MAKANAISLFGLTFKSSHLTQPIDRAVAGQVKKAWKPVVKQHFERSGYKTIDKENFAMLFAKLDKLAFFRRHVVAGFECTGIFPLNRNAIDPKLLKPSEPWAKKSNGGGSNLISSNGGGSKGFDEDENGSQNDSDSDDGSGGHGGGKSSGNGGESSGDGRESSGNGGESSSNGGGSRGNGGGPKRNSNSNYDDPEYVPEDESGSSSSEDSDDDDDDDDKLLTFAKKPSTSRNAEASTPIAAQNAVLSYLQKTMGANKASKANKDQFEENFCTGIDR